MVINIIVPGIGLSGGMRVLFQYGELFKAKGHDVVFYTACALIFITNRFHTVLPSHFSISFCSLLLAQAIYNTVKAKQDAKEGYIKHVSPKHENIFIPNTINVNLSNKLLFD